MEVHEPRHQQLRGLNSLNGIDMNQRQMHRSVGTGIDHNNSVFAKGEIFRVSDLVDLAVGHAQYERFKRLANKPLANGFHVHSGNSIPANIDLRIEARFA